MVECDLCDGVALCADAVGAKQAAVQNVADLILVAIFTATQKGGCCLANVRCRRGCTLSPTNEARLTDKLLNTTVAKVVSFFSNLTKRKTRSASNKERMRFKNQLYIDWPTDNELKCAMNMVLHTIGKRNGPRYAASYFLNKLQSQSGKSSGMALTVVLIDQASVKPVLS